MIEVAGLCLSNVPGKKHVKEVNKPLCVTAFIKFGF